MIHATLLALLLAACKTSSSAEAHASAMAKLDTDAIATQTVTQRVEIGPETITTTVEEWESGSRESNPPSRFGRPMPEPLGQTRTDSLLPSRVLVKRTVTVDQRAPAVATLATQAIATTETHAATATAQEAHSAHSAAPAFGCALGLGFWGALVLVGAMALLWVFRRVVFPWWPK